MRSVWAKVRKIEGLPIAAVLVTLYGVFMITSPEVFTGHRIYMSFLQTVPPMLVLAIGLTLVITAGEIDLSFPAVVAFSGFLYAWTFLHTGSPLLGLAAALAGGVVVGFVNGILVAKIGVPSIMATLAAQFFWAGLTVLLAGGKSWNLTGIESERLHTLLVGRLFGSVAMPAQAFWALGVAVVCWLILNRHKFGEAIMFVGDNANVARVMGINVERTKIKLFALNGLLGGFAAVLLTTEMNTFWTTQGEGYMLPVMAAVFIGGTSIAGGKGLVVGTFFGAYIIGSLEAGVVATGIGGYWTQLVTGLVMAASVVLNIVIGDGRLAAVASRVRHWSTPTEAVEEI
jgi:simple sugar transport system permease protein